MADKVTKARLVLKRGSSADWQQASAALFTPKLGEPIFYANSDYQLLKIGDGVHTPDELPTIADSRLKSYIDENFIKKSELHELVSELIGEVLSDKFKVNLKN